MMSRKAEAFELAWHSRVELRHELIIELTAAHLAVGDTGGGDDRRDAGRVRRRRRALEGAGVTMLVVALALLVCVLADAPARLSAGTVITLLALGSALSLLIFLRRSDTGWPLQPLIVGLLSEAGLGVFLIVEGAWSSVLVGDEVAMLIGLATAGAGLILQAVVGGLQKR
jgi:hypothetical protein